MTSSLPCAASCGFTLVRSSNFTLVKRYRLADTSHLAVVLNYLTWNKAISLYPLATFERRRSLILSENSSFPPAKEKYLARGFTFQQFLTPNEAGQPGPFQTGPRYVGDEKSWILDLETESIPLTSIPASRRECDPEMIHSWDLTDRQYSDWLDEAPPSNIAHGKLWQTGEEHVPLIYFSLLREESLNHKYVVHREFYWFALEVLDSVPPEDIKSYV
jgi:hypothetical protein